MDDASGNNANYVLNGYLIGSPYYRTEVGEFQNSDSPYDTFDQGGNVWEWTEAIPYISGNYAWRGLRGGAFDSYAYTLRSSYRDDGWYPNDDDDSTGFRVSQAVP